MLLWNSRTFELLRLNYLKLRHFKFFTVVDSLNINMKTPFRWQVRLRNLRFDRDYLDVLRRLSLTIFIILHRFLDYWNSVLSKLVLTSLILVI